MYSTQVVFFSVRFTINFTIRIDSSKSPVPKPCGNWLGKYHEEHITIFKNISADKSVCSHLAYMESTTAKYNNNNDILD